MEIRYKGKKLEILKSIITILLALVIVVLLRTYVFSFMLISGESMEPTMQNFDFVFVNKMIYQKHEPKIGDVVIVKDVVEPIDHKKRKLIKRVVGLPGDTVEVKGGELYKNGKKIKESYIKEMMIEDFPKTKVEKGFVFVMGDNRNNSADSRFFGAFERGQIEGKVTFELWNNPFKTKF